MKARKKTASNAVSLVRVPSHLIERVNKLVAKDATKMKMDTVPRCPERSVALRKLLEGKDAAVRAKMWKDTREPKP